MIVVSLGCPASVGPEVSVAALHRAGGAERVLVGSRLAVDRAAELLGVPRLSFVDFERASPKTRKIRVLDPGPTLCEADLDPRAASPAAGQSQLAAIEAAFALVKKSPRHALVTGPVSKARIASCGVRRARHFLGHTEWLQALDGAPSTTMCFHSPKLTTSLVTTHLPLSRVPKALTPPGVAEATFQLARFLLSLSISPKPALRKPAKSPGPKAPGKPGAGKVAAASKVALVRKPRIAVCSLNPHAGESELLGKEEARAIVPGIEAARRRLRGRATLAGPIGAESAYRLAHAGAFEGVVAMYHDQATIPMKLVAFGDAVNVTLGLSRIRTSVDHGTAYDIAWKGQASFDGMASAIALAQRMLTGRLRRPAVAARGAR